VGSVLSLEDVYEEIRDDERWDHLRQPGIVLVKGRGNKTDPRAMIVGEAPGATENTHRTPFCGPSGRQLRGLMGLAGLSDEDSFITNVVKYRPPGNRTPNTLEILNGTEALRKEWLAVGRPRLIVAVGATARHALAPVEMRLAPGNWAPLPDGRSWVWVHYHPAWAMRNGDKGKELVERHWEEMGAWIREVL